MIAGAPGRAAGDTQRLTVIVNLRETTRQIFFVWAGLGSVVVMVARGWLIQALVGGLAASGGRVNRRGLAA